jgi:hypothetical protein
MNVAEKLPAVFVTGFNQTEINLTPQNVSAGASHAPTARPAALPTSNARLQTNAELKANAAQLAGAAKGWVEIGALKYAARDLQAALDAVRTYATQTGNPL